MNINEQFEAKEKELEALKAQNETMLALNIHLANTIQSKVTDDKPTDLAWLTRDELKEYSDVHQAGGINAIKADAIGLAVHRFKYEYEGVLDASSVESFFDEIEADVRNNNG